LSLRRNYLPHQILSVWHYLTPIRQRDHVLTIPAPPPTEQRYLGIRDLVMGFEIQWFRIEFAVWGAL
jgi:hypothetical protein